MVGLDILYVDVGFTRADPAIKFNTQVRKLKVLSEKQHGLTQGKGTETAIFEFLRDIIHAIENGEVTAQISWSLRLWQP